MSFLNIISFLGIFFLCAIAWLFSENRNPKYFPWRVVIVGIVLQLILGALIFVIPGTRDGFAVFGGLFNGLFDAVDYAAQFVFGRVLVPDPPDGASIPYLLSPITPGGACAANSAGEVIPGFCGVQLGYIFAFRALPAVVFVTGFVALLYGLGILQVITSIFAKIFYALMRLSGAESLSGVINIFLGVESIITVRPFLAKMTRSELCTILTCGFGTAASSALAVYVGFLQPVFPNILGHLISASILAIPACFLLSKILVPETSVPLTAGRMPDHQTMQELQYPIEREIDRHSVSADPVNQAEPMHPVPSRFSPMDAAIGGAIDGVKVAAWIVAVLILILGLVYLINQLFVGIAALISLTGLSNSDNPILQGIAQFFGDNPLQHILGALFLPLTVLTGVSLQWNELWESSMLIGQRLFQTAIPSYQSLAAATISPEGTRVLSDRAILIVSYALSGFADLAAIGLFVGGAAALVPVRRREIVGLGWKALFAGTLATYMIACIAGFFDGLLGVESSSLLGTPAAPTQTAPAPATSPSPVISPSAVQTAPPILPSPNPAPAAPEVPAAPATSPAPAASSPPAQ
jgi:CNT family concentrative nucleoside transporter